MAKNTHRITPYPLRLEADLRVQLEEIAKDNGRSLNTEIAMRLKSSLDFNKDSFLTEKEVRRIAKELIREELNKK